MQRKIGSFERERTVFGSLSAFYGSLSRLRQKVAISGLKVVALWGIIALSLAVFADSASRAADLGANQPLPAYTIILLYGGSPGAVPVNYIVPSGKIDLGAWGSGFADEVSVPSYFGHDSLTVYTGGYYEGARIDLPEPIDLAQFINDPSKAFLSLRLGWGKGSKLSPSLSASTGQPLSKGEQLFIANQCAGCHRFKGAGENIGPALDGVGQRLSRFWIIEDLKNPQELSPGSIMPSHGDLSQQDLEALADYITGQSERSARGAAGGVYPGTGTMRGRTGAAGGAGTTAPYVTPGMGYTYPGAGGYPGTAYPGGGQYPATGALPGTLGYPAAGGLTAGAASLPIFERAAREFGVSAEQARQLYQRFTGAQSYLGYGTTPETNLPIFQRMAREYGITDAQARQMFQRLQVTPPVATGGTGVYAGGVAQPYYGAAGQPYYGAAGQPYYGGAAAQPYYGAAGQPYYGAAGQPYGTAPSAGGAEGYPEGAGGTGAGASGAGLVLPTSEDEGTTSQVPVGPAVPSTAQPQQQVTRIAEAPPTPPQAVRVVLVTDKGELATEGLALGEGVGEARGWVRIDVPLTELKGNKEALQGRIQRVVIAGDRPGTFYVGQVGIVIDEQPLETEVNIDVGLKGVAETRRTVVGEMKLTGASVREQVRVSWDFDARDGIQEDAEGRRVRFSFSEAGDYMVTVTVADIAGRHCWVRKQIPVTVEEGVPGSGRPGGPRGGSSGRFGGGGGAGGQNNY